MATEVPRLLFVHAHPDDESINNGATIAHYAARGAQVHVVTCTLGEEGEVIGDQLGAPGRRPGRPARRLPHRRTDGRAAPAGHRGADLPRRRRTLARLGNGWYASVRGHRRVRRLRREEAVGALVGIIRELRPHVVVTYDPNGGYGHPDHIRAPRSPRPPWPGPVPTTDPGEPWAVPKFYWTVTPGARSRRPPGPSTADDLLPHWQLPSAAPTKSASTTIRSPPCRRHRRLAAKMARSRPCHPSGRRPDGAGLCVVEQHGAAHPRSRALHPGVR